MSTFLHVVQAIAIPHLILWFLAGHRVMFCGNTGSQPRFLDRLCWWYVIFGFGCLFAAMIGWFIYMLPTIAKALLICVGIWFCVGSVVFIIDFVRNPSPIHLPRDFTELLKMIWFLFIGIIGFGAPITTFLAIGLAVIFGILGIISWIGHLGY